MTKRRKLQTGVLILIVAGLVGAGIVFLSDQSPGRFWIGGAATLGLLLGCVTGMSGVDGAGRGFISLVGTGVLIPLLGGVEALNGSQQVVTETTTTKEEVVVKVTETVKSFPTGSLHPLEVAGVFFVAFGILAVLGVIGGALLRKAGVIDLSLK